MRFDLLNTSIAAYIIIAFLTFGYAMNNIECELTNKTIDGCKSQIEGRSLFAGIIWPAYLSITIFEKPDE
jgi:hypothetical protein